MVKGLQEAEVELLEPCTHLVVTVPEEYMGKVLGDLSSHRRAHIQELGAQEAQGKERVITAITPLAGLMVSVEYLCGHLRLSGGGISKL